MFEQYYVPFEIAKALKEAGFNEPCMGIYISGNFHFYDPFKGTTNNTLNENAYAAPLYDQVFDWLFAKGLHIQYAYIAKAIIKELTGLWSSGIIDANDGNNLWPGGITWTNKQDYIDRHYSARRQGIIQAILAAIKLLNSDNTSQNQS